MVSQYHAFSSESSEAENERWLASLADSYTSEEIATFARAYSVAAQHYGARRLPTGVPVLQQAMGTAAVLASLKLDADAITAAILQAAPVTPGEDREALAAAFGDKVAALVAGVQKMGEMRGLADLGITADGHNRGQTEALRQMILAMVEDIRVVLIKLAERVQTLRTLGGADPEERFRIAHEIMEIFAPLANRLGVWQIKWELEDLSFRYLEPGRYKQIARLLDEKRTDRQKYIDAIIAQLQALTAAEGITAQVTGRPKHIMSILRKMVRKHKTFEQIYDVRAVRVLVEDIRSCYTVLGLIHQLWQPIPGEFDDYIAQPKANNYRALHTAVIGPEGKALEVQICTHDMYKHAEFGVAAHWRYKEGRGVSADVDEKIAWLRQILQWKEDLQDGSDLVERFKTELFQDKVYVLTPQGKVVDLPRGATPVDFAYALHTDLGHRTRGALVDGSIVPLNYELSNGQRVEILTHKHGSPSRDWLIAGHGYLKTNRARARVRQWFKMQDHDSHVAQGRTLLDKELHRLNVTGVPHDRISQDLHFARTEDFLAALGRGDVTLTQLAQAVQHHGPPRNLPAPVAPKGPGDGGRILLSGEGDLLTVMARCCKPLPPDEIVGYITRGRGATIHRADCVNLARLTERWEDRIVPADWGSRSSGHFAADIELFADRREGLLQSLQEILAREKVAVLGMSTHQRQDEARIRYTLEVEGGDQLARILGLLRQLPFVKEAARRT